MQQTELRHDPAWICEHFPKLDLADGTQYHTSWKGLLRTRTSLLHMESFLPARCSL